MALTGGHRFPVGMADVFPHGCNLLPGSIAEAMDYDEKTGRRSPATDKVTGRKVFSCRVFDRDPDLAGRSAEVVVKILSDRMPPAPTGQPFEPVEFDQLMVTPYVNDRGRMAYSLRATGIKAARQAPASKDAA